MQNSTEGRTSLQEGTTETLLFDYFEMFYKSKRRHFCKRYFARLAIVQQTRGVRTSTDSNLKQPARTMTRHLPAVFRQCKTRYSKPKTREER